MKNLNRLREKLGFAPVAPSVKSDPFDSCIPHTAVEDLSRQVTEQNILCNSAHMEYVQGSNLAPKHTAVPGHTPVHAGSVCEAKQAAGKHFVQEVRSGTHNKHRLRSKLKDSLRKFDRHKKEEVQYQSAMDWVIAQKGLLFDIMMFATSTMLNKSVKGSIPFALSLLSHHLPSEVIDEAQNFLQSLCTDYVFQSDADVEPASGLADATLNEWYRKYQKSTNWLGIKKLYIYVTCLILHGPSKCRERDIKRMAESSNLESLEATGNVVVNILSLTKSLFTNFFQCVASGDWSDFFHSETTYDRWFNDNLEVERRFAECVIPNDAHSLMAKTESLLKQGREMLSRLRGIKDSRTEILAVNNRYLKTYELYTKFVGGVTATQLRRTPFCLQISGKSKIGKTSFLKLNEIQYAHLYGKDKNVESYVRQSADRFWDAYQANQWSIIFDDVCAHNPAVVMGVDEFHKDVLHIINNVPKMAECAALEDKGTKPILCDLVQVTTNIPDLHAGHYFYDTAALFRRLQFRVKLELRAEYKGTDGFIDPRKIPSNDAFPDLWHISVEKAVTKPYGHDANREQGCWEEIPALKRLDMWNYLQWFKRASREHVEAQNKFLLNMRTLKETFMCSECNLPLANHPENVACVQLQSDADIERMFVEDHVDRPADLYNIPEEIPEEESFYQRYCPTFDFSEYPSRLMLFILGQMNKLLNKKGIQNSQTAIAIYHVISFIKDYWVMRMVLHTVYSMSWYIGIPLALCLWFATHPSWFLQQIGMMPQGIVLENVTTAVQLYCAMRLADTAEVVRLAGRKVFQALGGTSQILLIIGILTTGLATLYALLRTFIPSDVGQPETRYVQQGDRISSLVHGREPENVWRMHDYRCNVIDVPCPSSSLKGSSEIDIVSYFHRYLVRVSIRWQTDDPAILRVAGGTGIFLGGQKILLPSHFFDREKGLVEIFSVTVFYATRQNVIRQATCQADSYSLEAFDGDMSILTFPAISAQRAIDTTIPSEQMLKFVGPGLRIGRDKAGTLVVDRLKCIKSAVFKQEPHWIAGEGPDAITKKGDCGAILLALTPSGPVLVGVHLWLCIGTNNASMSYNLCGKKFGKIISAQSPKLDNLGKVGELQALHPKSPIQFLDDLGGMQVFGSFSGFRTSVKSRVQETIGASYLKLNYGFQHTHGPPVMAGREVKYLHLQSFKRINASVPEYQAELACAVLLQHVLEHSDEWQAYQISQRDAVNGVPGVRFIDRIPISTSCGFPYKTPKYNKIHPVVDDDWTSELEVDEDIQADIDFIMYRWSRGERAMPVFTAALKDEPRKFSKIESKSTRIFYGGPAGLIIAERMIFTWFTRLVQTHPLVFMQAPGMDATGSQWNLLLHWMKRSDQWIAGDMKEFDISMIIQFLRMAYKFIILLAKHLEADASHVQQMEAAAEDLINPMVDYFGDLIMGTGKNPSGHALTVIINGLVNAFYMIWCFLTLHPKADIQNRYYTLGLGEEFFQDVRAMFYGDDNFMNVVESNKWFNHTAISELLRSVRVTYTMADKDRESVPFIPLSEVSFLKRSFRFEEAVNGYVAPLELASVHKALMLTIPSKMVSLEKAYADCIVSQNDTMWHHGRDEFERFQLLLFDLIQALELESYFVRPLLSFDELTNRWLKTLDSPENRAWFHHDNVEYQSDATIEHVSTESQHECPRCGRCPYEEDPNITFEPCQMCGGCTFDDPWCSVCQEDGYCSCGELYDFTVMVNRSTLSVTILIACGECDYFRLKKVPLTKVLALAHGIPWSEVQSV